MCYYISMLGQFFLEYIQICSQVRRSVISATVDLYMLLYEKWEIITEILDSWKFQNVGIFYFWKSSPKNGQNFQLFTLYSKGRHFSITKLDILIFCNILHLEIDFWNLNSKRIASLWNWQKCREKHHKWDIEKKWNSLFNSP